MASLRVRLEFPDKEKFWLFIDLSQIKTIQDVIDYIDTKHSVSCFKLWLDDAQLYCRETVRILQDGDLIRYSFDIKQLKVCDLIIFFKFQSEYESEKEEDRNSR